MEKIDEILGAINTFRNDSLFRELKVRWQKDFDLFRLKPYNAGKGYISYTSNSPRVLASRVMAVLSGANLQIHVPEDTLTDEEARTANNLERFYYGALVLNDAELRKGQLPPLQAQLAWYAVMRGWVVLRPYVYKNDAGLTCPDVRAWDIYNTAYGRGNDGLDWAAHTYKLTPSEAKKRYDIKSGNSDVEVVDFWDTERYGVFCQNKWVRPLAKHNTGRCPIIILPVGSTPAVWQDNDNMTGAQMGESIFANNRDLYPIMNKTLSDLLTIQRRGVKVPLGVWTIDGESPINEDIWQVEKASVVNLHTGDVVQPLMPQTMPADTSTLINWTSGEDQRGGLPHTALGELGFRLSGFAINQLNDTTLMVLNPFLEVMANAYLAACLELSQQFTAKKNLPAIKVRGRTSRNAPFGYPAGLDIKPEDIAGDWHPEVKLVLTLPSDDAQKYQLAQLARTPGPDGQTPLLSDETIRGDLIGVKDPDLERQKISKEWAGNLMINKLWDAYFAAVRAGDVVYAQNLLIEVQRLLMTQGQQTGQRPQQPGLSPTAGAAMGMTGVGLPSGPTGVPASTMPPETGGGMPPGAMNAKPLPIGGV